MSFLLGGGSNASTPTQAMGLNIQTSVYGSVVPLCYGTVRISGNLIWYGEFTATGQSNSGKGVGGGGGKGVTSYTYAASFVIALCEGGASGISGIGKVWVSKAIKTMANLGFTLFSGAIGQSPWGHFISKGAARTFVNNETAMVPAAGPYTYQVGDYLAYVADEWVAYTTYASSANLTKVTSNPTVGQYAVDTSSGTYTFAAADAGRSVQIHYTYTADIAYSGLTYIAAANHSLGQSSELPQYNFEAEALKIYSGQKDALPADVVTDLLTDPYHGAGFPSARLGDLTTYTEYCLGMGFYISAAYTSQTDCASMLSDIVEYTNSALVWASGKLTIVPYGDEAVGSYTPPSAPLFSLTDDDFLDAEEPVKLNRTRPADKYNSITMEFENRANYYNTETLEVKDAAGVMLYGYKSDTSRTTHLFGDKSIVKQAAQLVLHRQQIQNVYTFKLGWRYCVLDCMDIVEITDAALGLTNQWVRITQIDEDDNGELTITAEEYLYGTGATPLYDFDEADAYVADQHIDPGLANAPVIFEAPTGLNEGLELCVAVSGGSYTGQLVGTGDGSTLSFQLKVTSNGTSMSISSLNGSPTIYLAGVKQTFGWGWSVGTTGIITFATAPTSGVAITADFSTSDFWGGCEVYASTDGSTYKLMGTIDGCSKMGVLTAALPSISSSPDSTNTLAIDLTESHATLTGGTDSDAQLLNTLAYVDGEWLAYATATLTAANRYSLSYLVRGAYSTAISAHASGSPFVRLDSAFGKFTYDSTLIGTTIYLKCLGKNLWNGIPGSISDCTAHPYAITGSAYAMPDPEGFSAKITNKNDIQLQWACADLPSTFDHFEIYNGASIASGTLLSQTKQYQYLITDPAPGTETYWVRTVSTLGTHDPTPPSVSITIPTIYDVTSLAATITNKSDVKLTWVKPSSLPKGFEGYEIRYGATWATATLIGHTKILQYLVTDPVPGTITYWIGVLDKSGNYDSYPQSVSITTPSPSSATNLQAKTTNKSDLYLWWTKPTAPPTDFDYEIRVGGTTWGTATFVGRCNQMPNYTDVDPVPGTNLWWIGVRDKAGNYDSSPPSVAFTVLVPGDVGGLAATMTSKEDILLKWTKPSSLPTGFKYYEIRYATSAVGWASATHLTYCTTVTHTVVDPSPGTTYYYYVGVFDHALNCDTTPQVVSIATPSVPSITGLTATISKKKDVVLKWTAVSFSFLQYYEIRYATSAVGWASATYLGKTKGETVTLVDPSTGTMYYYVGVKDLNGNYDSSQEYVEGTLSSGFVLGCTNYLPGTTSLLACPATNSSGTIVFNGSGGVAYLYDGIMSTGQTAPDGTATAYALASDGNSLLRWVPNSWPFVVGQTYTFSVWLAPVSGYLTSVNLDIGDTGISNGWIPGTTGTSWAYYTVTFTYTSAPGGHYFDILRSMPPGYVIAFWHPKLEKGDVATDYTGALAGSDSVSLGSGTVVSSTGATLTDGAVITSQGTAAAIANQGALATKNTVDTLTIDANSATGYGSGYVSSCGLTGSTPIDIININFTTTVGTAVEITATICSTTGCSAAARTYLAITRNGSVIYGAVASELSSGGGGGGSGNCAGQTATFFDAPGIGTFTYSIVAYRDAGTSNINGVSLQVIELKR